MDRIRIGVIGYGVRIDMLMDEMYHLPVEARVVAVADRNPERVKELMLKNGSAERQHKMEIDKIDGMLRKCPMEPHAPVVVSFPLRITRMIQEAKKILDAGIIGKVEHVQAYNDVAYGFVYFHDWYRDESVAHGLFLQKATHDIDLINYLCNEKPVSVCAMKSKQLFKGDMPAGLRCSECDKAEDCI